MIETRLLNYFLAIAREENITKAANTLHISQPALSKQMTDLEEQLGTKLFIRGNKNTKLTEDGALFRSRAQEIINLIEKTESDISTGTTDISGEIYLGCGESHVMDYIVGIFETLHKEYPDIHFHIYSGNAESVLERLDKGLLDAGLLLGSMNNEKYDLKDLGLYDRFGLLMTHSCPLSKKEYITYEDLQNLSILMPQQSIASSNSLDEFVQTLFQMKHTINIVGTYNLLYNAIFMVEHNIGSAICIEGLVDTDSRNNLVFKPLYPEVRLNSYIVTKKYQSFSKAMKIFLDRL